MHSVVVFTPTKNGDYRITIKIDETDICNSPHRGVAIDGTINYLSYSLFTILAEHTPKIKELAFSQDWLPETTQLYSLLAQRGIYLCE